MSSLASAIGGAVNLTKGVVKIVDTETVIKSRSNDPIGSMALGTDTDKLYIHIGSGSWVVVNTNPA